MIDTCWKRLIIYFQTPYTSYHVWSYVCVIKHQEPKKLCIWFFSRITQSLQRNLKSTYVTATYKRLKFTKFLGVVVDENLNWKEHVNMLTKKVAKSVGLLYKARKSLNGKDLLPIYYAYIYSYLTYALPIWGNSPKVTIHRLFKLQKRAIRVISGIKRLESITKAFRDLKLLQLPELKQIHRHAVYII